MNPICLLVLLLVFQIVYGSVTFEDLRGQWRGPVDSEGVQVLTPQGPFLMCRSQIPDECLNEIPPGEETYKFHENKFHQRFTQLIGVKTMNQSAEKLPSCAKHKIYPTKAYVEIPWSKVVDFKSEEGHFHYIDHRAPNKTRCQVMKYSVGEEGPRIEVHHYTEFHGAPAKLAQIGVEFRCTNPPKECYIGFDESGALTFRFHDTFTLKCVKGPCMNQTTKFVI